MNSKSYKGTYGIKWRALFVLLGVTTNVLLAFICGYFELPLFLDTIGTVVVASVGGVMPGAFTAILTNVFCTPFNTYSVFYAIINIAIALLSSLYKNTYSTRGYRYIILFILAAGLFSGGVSAFIQWHLFFMPQNPFIANSIAEFGAATGLPYFSSFVFVNIVVDIIDKGISIGIALNIIYFIPAKIKDKIKYGGWQQAPISDEELETVRKWGRATKLSMRSKLTMLLLAISVAVIIIMSIIELRLYYNKDIEEKKEIARQAAIFTAAVVDPEKIDEYINGGESVAGYEETEALMYKIRDNAMGVAYLYLAKIDDEDMVYIFDLDEKSGLEDIEKERDANGYEPGERVPLDEEYLVYKDDFKQGKEIPQLELRNSKGWIITSLYPVFNEAGDCVCYAGADISVEYVSEFLKEFTWRIVLILSSILVTIFVYGMWATSIFLVYPVSRLGLGVEQFIQAGDNQTEIDAAVKYLRNMKICTADEIEKLYKSICDMALNQAEQIRSIRHFTENTTKMQDGLIITMADLVERRDATSGSHIQKTSAYVKIIAEGLEKKGYYPGKVTPKFISDVVRSAPLHDIGKINVPDSILNKTGKLTDEEIEIRRSHTTAGKLIMENAISTVAGENYLKEARNMAAYHHEKWDGSGYPEGLHGEVIPLSARIMAVANQFDALTSSKVDGREYTFEEAVSIIQEGAGTKYDSKCVEVFMDALPEIKVVYRKYNKKIEDSIL